MPSIIVLDTLSPDGLALLDASAESGISYEVMTGLSGMRYEMLWPATTEQSAAAA